MNLSDFSFFGALITSFCSSCSLPPPPNIDFHIFRTLFQLQLQSSSRVNSYSSSLHHHTYTTHHHVAKTDTSHNTSVCALSTTQLLQWDLTQKPPCHLTQHRRGCNTNTDTPQGYIPRQHHCHWWRCWWEVGSKSSRQENRRRYCNVLADSWILAQNQLGQ